jgi:hypothetical protein
MSAQRMMLQRDTRSHGLWSRVMEDFRHQDLIHRQVDRSPTLGGGGRLYFRGGRLCESVGGCGPSTDLLDDAQSMVGVIQTLAAIRCDGHDVFDPYAEPPREVDPRFN